MTHNLVRALGLSLVLCGAWCSVADASIVLKLIAANPSKTQVQKVPIKAYLPKETKPDHILSRGDLEVAYDTQQGSYYVYGDYDLKPGEVLEKEVELVDIWLIPAGDIESLRAEMAKMEELLKSTEFAERVNFLKSNIDTKLAQIIENQINSPSNPERHISNYRDNARILESAKADLVLLRSLLSQAKSIPPVVIWRLILTIILFLGVLGVSFYFVWHRQLKTIADTLVTVAPAAGPGGAPADPPSKDREPKQAADGGLDDIEKLMGEEP